MSFWVGDAFALISMATTRPERSSIDHLLDGQDQLGRALNLVYEHRTIEPGEKPSRIGPRGLASPPTRVGRSGKLRRQIRN
jgi:hypothetical protein